MKKINRREFIGMVGGGASLALGNNLLALSKQPSGSLLGSKTKKPNVVILLNDQHAHNAIGCAGYGKLRTPVYDQLAADGIRFTQANCATTPCLPSRHNIFHGLYAFQTGIYSNGHCIPLSDIPEFTMGKIFKNAGYRTGTCGKMHWFPYGSQVPDGNYFGFDWRGGYTFKEVGEKMERTFFREHPDLAKAYYYERKERGISMGGGGSKGIIGYQSKLTSDQFSDWWIAQQAVEYIKNNRNKPFLLVCSLRGPHMPHVVPHDLWDLYDPKDVPLPGDPSGEWATRLFKTHKAYNIDTLKRAITSYMACVTHQDMCHAMVINALKKYNLYNNTLIVFTSDHGEKLGLHGFGKYSLHEQAIRVPFIIKPPKSSANNLAGKVEHKLVSTVDILPTVMEIAELPNIKRLPGTSLAPLFSGKSANRDRKVNLTCIGEKSVGIRSRQWKLMLHPKKPQLYNLEKDPLENRNLFQLPDSANRITGLKSDYIEELAHIFQTMGARCRGYKRIKNWPHVLSDGIL